MNNIFHIPFTVDSKIEIDDNNNLKECADLTKDSMIVDGILIKDEFPTANNDIDMLDIKIYDPFRLFDEWGIG